MRIALCLAFVVAAGCFLLGDVEYSKGNLEAAQRAYEKALEIRLRLAAILPDDAKIQLDLAGTHEELGTVAMQQGRVDSMR